MNKLMKIPFYLKVYIGMTTGLSGGLVIGSLIHTYYNGSIPLRIFVTIISIFFLFYLFKMSLRVILNDEQCEHIWHELTTHKILKDEVVSGQVVGVNEVMQSWIYCPKCDKRGIVDADEWIRIDKSQKIKENDQISKIMKNDEVLKSRG